MHLIDSPYRILISNSSHKHNDSTAVNYHAHDGSPQLLPFNFSDSHSDADKNTSCYINIYNQPLAMPQHRSSKVVGQGRIDLHTAAMDHRSAWEGGSTAEPKAYGYERAEHSKRHEGQEQREETV